MTDSRSRLVALLGFFSGRRLAVGAVAAATVMLAVVSLIRMPLQLLPEIRYPQVRIIGDLPGQTSRVIEESINEPMEAALAGIPGVVQLESRSGDGRAYLDLFFEPDYDLDRALRDVTQAAQRAQAQIPPEFPEPRIFAVSTMEDPVIQLAFGSTARSVPEIRQALRSTLLPRLRGIPGVDAVYMGREEVPELVVEVDPIRQAANGVRLATLEDLLVEATEPPPSSPVRTPSFEGIGVLGVSGWDVERLNRQPVPVDGTRNAVPLRAIGSAHRAPSEESLRTRLDGGSAVLVSIHRSPRAHSLRMADEIQEVVEEVAAAPAMAGIEGTVLYDDSAVTRTAVRSVLVATAGGAMLAMLLLFFGLRQRRYVPLVAVVVGVSLAGAVVVLHAMGMTLNLLTLAGLLLSVGLGLDYAIIYFDRLDRIRRETPGRAGSDGDRHLRAMADVAGPLLGALLTTLAAVLPFLFVEGLVALLFRPLIWTVVVSAVFSFLFGVVLLSAFARVEQPAGGAEPAGGGEGSVARPDGAESGEADDESGGSRLRRFRARLRGFGPFVPPRAARWGWVREPAATWVGVGLLGAVLLLGGRALPFEVLPVVDDGFVDVRITHPAGIPAQEMDRLTRRVEERLLAVEGTDALFTTVGGYFREGLPSFRPGTANFMIRVDTDGGRRPSARWADDARDAIAGLEVPELAVAVTLPRIRGVQTRLADADLLVVLTREDDDLLALSEVESQVMAILEGIDGLTDVARVRGGVSPRWMARPRYDALAAHGVSPAELGRVMEYTLEGKVLRQRMESGEPLALRVRYDRRNAGGPQQLASSRVPGLAGGDVSFGDLVDFELIEEPTHIERREGQRVVRVAAHLDPAGPGPAATGEAVSRALEAAELPSGVSWWLEGELEALQETSRTFTLALVLALVLVLTLLVVQYGSISFAAAGLLSIPLSGAGTVILLGLLARPLDAMVLAGLLIAVGIVANNVILVLSQARERSTGPEAVPLDRAVREAARVRLRPITLTVLSTVLGMSPLLLGGAEVFGLLQPLAIALTGALLVSVPLACLLLPGVVISFAALGERVRWRGRPADARSAPAE